MQSENILQMVKGSHSRSIFSPYELQEAYPSPLHHTQFITDSRNTIKNILQGKDPRLLLITGPCSIHDLESTIEYANRLKELSQSISDFFFVVMRVYFEKPRTAGGWKGYSLDPYLDGSNDIAIGHALTRQLLLQLAELEIPAATEFLELTSSLYFGDLISWGCIGARTVESQVHRQMASGLEMPIAFKNNTSGNVEAAVNGIYASSQPHSFVTINNQGLLAVSHTEGNPWGHLVLRGGEGKPNYDRESIARAVMSLKQAELSPSILIDCSHDNSFRDHSKQSFVLKSLIEQILEGNSNICGLSLESHLNEGKQAFPQRISELRYGVSLTDSCMGWETTRNLILWGYSALKNMCLAAIAAFGLNACQCPEKLSAFSEYIVPEQLASYRVGTPDPKLICPSVGQRIFIKWNLPIECEGQELVCKLHLRFRDHTECIETIQLEKIKGFYIYSLLNEEYFSRDGILTYKIDLYVNGTLAEEWRHQMWVNLIAFPEECDK